MKADRAMRRHVSEITLRLLDGVGISPNELDVEIDARIARRSPAVLPKHHPMLMAMSQTANLNIVQVTRRSRYLLVEIEQWKESEPLWQYRELSPRRCSFACRSALPEVLASALAGKLLTHLAQPSSALNDTVITEVYPSIDGWLSVEVAPRWKAF
jgi:hypothetical protein